MSNYTVILILLCYVIFTSLEKLHFWLLGMTDQSAAVMLIVKQLTKYRKTVLNIVKTSQNSCKSL